MSEPNSEYANLLEQMDMSKEFIERNVDVEVEFGDVVRSG
jgi:hypothetical protein